MIGPMPPLSAEQVRLLATPAQPWLSCDACFDLTDVAVDGLLQSDGPRLGDDVLDSLRAHLATCPACAEEVDSLLQLVSAEDGADASAARRTLGL
jgi:hypothetical protein